jgi:hypothetical protein
MIFIWFLKKKEDDQLMQKLMQKHKLLNHFDFNKILQNHEIFAERGALFE